MSFIGAGRNLGWMILSAGNQIRAISALQHCRMCGCLQRVPFQQHACRSSPIHRGYVKLTTENGSDSPERATRPKAVSRMTGKFQKKLHSRVFTEDELTDNRNFIQNVQCGGDDGDEFGTLQYTKSPKAYVQSKAEAVEEFNKDNQLKRNHGLKETNVFKNYPGDGADLNTDERVKRFPGKSRQLRTRDSWSNKFGTLTGGQDAIADKIEESLSSAVGSHEERFSDDGDEQESKYVRLSAVNRRHIPEWYGRRILKLGKRGKIREAVEVFEDWMLKEDRVMPNSYVFTCIITVLGRAGYTRKAFSLFNKMKKMGIQPKPATYTALFNACANSPWKDDGNSRADNLFQLMKEKQVEPTFITGKAMIKAFALCGNLRQAFALVDELSQRYRPDPEVFSFLLMACISDKEEGLRHAIQVWRLMGKMKVQPDLPLYNLLIRCVRDCGVGDVESFTALFTGNSSLEQDNPDLRLSQNKTQLQVEEDTKMLELKELQPVRTLKTENVSGRHSAPHSESFVKIQEPCVEDADQLNKIDVRERHRAEHGQLHDLKSVSTDLQQGVQSKESSSLVIHSSGLMPDVLAGSSNDIRIISLGNLSTKESRLSLLGGVDGILSRMRKDGATPNVITFTQLLSVAMPTVDAEEQLLACMRKMKVKPDIDFINALIHKRCMRADFVAARNLGDLMLEYGLTANQMTYGVLAMTCKSKKDATQLLDDMEAAEMAPNMEIMGTLMFASGMNFFYKLWVIRQVQRQDMKPNAKFLENIEKSLLLARRKIVEAEKQGKQDSYFLSSRFQQSFDTFEQNYETWLKQTQVEVPRHPWASFKPISSDNKDVASG